MSLSLAEELNEIINEQSNEQPRSNINNVIDIFEAKQSMQTLDDVNDASTLSLLQHARVVQSERANITIREALNNHGASLSQCAAVLSAIIQSPGIAPEIRRRAVIDVLTLHNANPLPLRNQPDSPQLAITIQTSDKVNLSTILNPNGKRDF